MDFEHYGMPDPDDDPCLKKSVERYRKGYLKKNFPLWEQWRDEHDNLRPDGDHEIFRERCDTGEAKGDPCKVEAVGRLKTRNGLITGRSVDFEGKCKKGN